MQESRAESRLGLIQSWRCKLRDVSAPVWATKVDQADVAAERESIGAGEQLDSEGERDLPHLARLRRPPAQGVLQDNEAGVLAAHQNAREP